MFPPSSSDQTSTSNMKIDTLNFLTVLLTQHSPSVLHPHIGAIIPAVVSSVDDSFYKITSEALLVLQLIVKTIRPLGKKLDKKSMMEDGIPKLISYLPPLKRAQLHE